MQDSFDPYRHWLGLAHEQATNHYALLGLALGENDPATIARAVEAAIGRVRRALPGEHLAEWQELLDQLNEARRCLLNPATKGQYDAVLRGAGKSDRSTPSLSALPPGVEVAAPPTLGSPSSGPSGAPSSSLPFSSLAVKVETTAPPGETPRRPPAAEPHRDPMSVPSGSRRTPPHIEGQPARPTSNDPPSIPIPRPGQRASTAGVPTTPAATASTQNGGPAPSNRSPRAIESGRADTTDSGRWGFVLVVVAILALGAILYWVLAG